MTSTPTLTRTLDAESEAELLEQPLPGKPYGEIVAENVSEADYMEHYAASYHEYVRGYIVKMSPASFRHNNLIDHLRDMLKAYFSFNPIGITISSPFVIRLPTLNVRREPDLQIILNENLSRLQPTYTDGPADICIEVVSPSNEATDYGEKLLEYEAGGVREYWMFDAQRLAAYFYRRNDEGVFISTPMDANRDYQTPLLPRFRLPVTTLWQEPLPTLLEVIQQVRTSLNIQDEA